MAGHKVLCVAEKNSIAKAVAQHLGGSLDSVRITLDGGSS
jgi:DNA topoisomerase IA